MPVRFPQPFRVAATCGTLATASLLLGGCVFESPYWAQTFPSTTSQIPIQTWTNSTTNPVQISCAKAYHGGLVAPTTWIPVTTIAPSTTAVYDTNGNAIYAAGRKLVLPASCWHADGAYSPPKYMTGLRARQLVSGTTKTFEVFTLTGLSCIGRWNGAGGSWYSYLSRSCPVYYSGTTTPVDHVRVIANTLGAGVAAPAPMPEAAATTIAGEPGKGLRAAPAPLLQWQQRYDASAPSASDAQEASTLQAAWDRQRPTGTRLQSLDCRGGLCRVEVLHEDDRAEVRFVQAFASVARFADDGRHGHVERSRSGSAIRSVYFLARNGADDGPQE